MKNELIKVNKRTAPSRGATVISATSASQGHFDDVFITLAYQRAAILKSQNINHAKLPKILTCSPSPASTKPSQPRRYWRCK